MEYFGDEDEIKWRLRELEELREQEREENDNNEG